MLEWLTAHPFVTLVVCILAVVALSAWLGPPPDDHWRGDLDDRHHW